MPEVQPFGVKAGEAIAYLKGKLPEVSLSWDALAGPVHGKVFTVAGATSTSLVSDLHQAVTAAADNGTTITEFRKAFDQAVTKHGWSYKGTRGWRTRIILGSNMRSATMAGRWTQLWAGRERRPYLQYRDAGDSRVRPQHRQWNGIIRAITDVFWQTFYPPNGWLCRCTVRALTLAEVIAKGLTVDTEAFEVKYRLVRKKGEPTDRVPVGIDPGWDHNVGVSWIAPEVALGQKLIKLPPALRDQMINKTISPAFQSVLNDRWKDFRGAVKATPMPGRAQIVGFLDGATVKGLEQVGSKAVPPSTAMAVAADDIAALDWPASLLDSLPENLRNYRAVLWDAETESLVFIPQESARLKDGKATTVSVQVAADGPAKGALAVRAAGRTDLGDLRRMKLLVGAI